MRCFPPLITSRSRWICPSFEPGMILRHNGDMKNIVLAMALCLSPLPAFAQSTEAAPPAADVDEGVSLMQEGAKLLFRGLMGQMEPTLKDMTTALGEVEPKLRELLAMVDDIRNYHAPEKLENGDIIIRRKTPEELKLEGLKGDEFDL